MPREQSERMLAHRIGLANATESTPMAVDKIQFSMMSVKEMAHAAVIQCTHEDLYTMNNGFVPVPGGVLDLRLGTSNKDRMC